MPAATMKTERGAFALHQKGKAMKVYFDKEGLIESLEFYRDNNARYFFFSVSSVYPFVKYEEELAEINDYCLFVLCQLENKLKALIAESEGRFELVKGYRRQREYTVEELDVFFDPAYMFSPVTTWENLSHDINKNTMLLLLLSYLESSLNEIAQWFCEVCSIPLGKKQKGTNEIAFYIQKIGECCQCDLTETLQKELLYLGRVRKIRNRFVHKAWEQEEEQYDQFYLCDVFRVVSMIFTQIERAACHKGIIEEDQLFSKG